MPDYAEIIAAQEVANATDEKYILDKYGATSDQYLALTAEIQDKADASLTQFLKDLDRSYNVKYPGFCRNKKYDNEEECEKNGSIWTTNVIPGVPVLGQIQAVIDAGQHGGIGSVLQTELKVLSNAFKKMVRGNEAPIRNNPGLYVKGGFVKVSADVIRSLNPTSGVCKDGEDTVRAVPADKANAALGLVETPAGTEVLISKTKCTAMDYTWESPKPFVEVSYSDLKKMKLVPMDGLKKRKPETAWKEIQFGGNCSDSAYENRKDCEDNNGDWSLNDGDIKYVGVTHKTFMQRPKALISYEIKKIRWKKGSAIKLYFRNPLTIYEYERVLSLAIAASGKVTSTETRDLEQNLPETMHLAQYFNPNDPATGDSITYDLFDTIRESARAAQKDYMMEFKDGLGDAAVYLVEKTLEEEALCCLFMAFLEANPKVEKAITWDTLKIPMRVGGIDGYWKDVTISEFLESQQDALRATKIILEFLLNMMLGYGKAALNPLMFNLTEMLTNMLYMAAAANMREAQSAVTKMIEQWVQEEIERQKEFAKQKWDEKAGSCSEAAPNALDITRADVSSFEGVAEVIGEVIAVKFEAIKERSKCILAGGEWISAKDKYEALLAALRCLPLEQVIIMLIRSFIGKDSIFDNISALFQRITLYFKRQNSDANFNLIGYVNKKAKASTATHLIKGAIEIIDWLLALNTEGLLICNKYNINDVSDLVDEDGPPGDYGSAFYEQIVDCHFPDGSVTQMSWLDCARDCGYHCIPCPAGSGDDGILCPAGQRCDEESGSCVVFCDPENCIPPQICVVGSCQDPTSNVECLYGCPEGEVCDNTTGTCVPDTGGLGGKDDVVTGYDPSDFPGTGNDLYSSFGPLLPGGPHSGNYDPGTGQHQPGAGVNASLGYSPKKKYSERIDITGEGVDPLRLLVLKEEGEISKFFNSYLGLNPEAAKIAASNAKKGTCLGGLNDKQRAHIMTLLNEIGLEV